MEIEVNELNNEVLNLTKANKVALKEKALLRKQRDEILNKYQSGGLTKQQASLLEREIIGLKEQVHVLTLEKERYIEIASAASQQTKQVK